MGPINESLDLEGIAATRHIWGSFTRGGKSIKITVCRILAFTSTTRIGRNPHCGLTRFESSRPLELPEAVVFDLVQLIARVEGK